MTIKILRSAKILNLRENIGLSTLIAEAVSTWSKKHPEEIEKEMSDEEFNMRYGIILEAVRDGYSSILEMPSIHFQSIMPRIATLALVSFSIGANFLQQSLRYTVPLIKEEQEKATLIVVPETLKNKEGKILKHTEKGIELYKKIVSEIEVSKTRKPEEDARYHLPLCITTFISASINLSHLTYMLALLRLHDEEKLPVTRVWRDFVAELTSKTTSSELAKKSSENIRLGKFYPTAYPFMTPFLIKKLNEQFAINQRNEVKLLGYNLESLKLFDKEEIKEIIRKGIKEGSFNDFNDVSFEFAIKESVISRHQTIRHRTIPQQSLSVYDAASRFELLIPSSIRQSKLLKEYLEYLEESKALFEELKDEDENEAILVLPSNIAMITKLRLDGYNIFNFRGFLGNRCCELAQAETQLIASMINLKIKEVLENEGYKELTSILHANCFKIRRCPELLERAINCTIFKSKSFEKEL